MGRALWYQDILDENLRLRIENDSVKEENRLLKAENARLRKRLGKEVRDAREAPFEENTPSSFTAIPALSWPRCCSAYSP